MYSNRQTPQPINLNQTTSNLSNFTQSYPINDSQFAPLPRQDEPKNETSPINSEQVTSTLKFKNNKKFDDKYRDYFYLEEYIKNIKPTVSLVTVYINKNEELIIKTNNKSDIDDLKKWPQNAFDYGITEIVKSKRFYLAFHNVDTKFDIESERVKARPEDYDIDNTLRMMKKSTGKS
ncbi:unnamed protein product [Brachionus calyciflorus]|uniref:Uncharacterized protein n=1 Tax=Brachionus calyciflorus TaxID=104777 RepID=A0A814M4M9_9BILA|nr:unnamed protein product [Brachionus calyciflorus]